MSRFCVIIPSIQWYKVYKDPEGTHSLETKDHTDAGAANNTNVGAGSTDENYYKSKIQNLNQEIIVLNQEIIVLNKKNNNLNDELAMVSTLMHCLLRCVVQDVFP